MDLFHVIVQQSGPISSCRSTKWTYFILSFNKVDLFHRSKMGTYFILSFNKVDLFHCVVQQSGLISYCRSNGDLFHLVVEQSGLISFCRPTKSISSCRSTKWTYFIVSFNKVDLFHLVVPRSGLISFCRSTKWTYFIV